MKMVSTWRPIVYSVLAIPFEDEEGKSEKVQEKFRTCHGIVEEKTECATEQFN